MEVGSESKPSGLTVKKESDDTNRSRTGICRFEQYPPKHPWKAVCKTETIFVVKYSQVDFFMFLMRVGWRHNDGNSMDKIVAIVF